MFIRLNSIFKQEVIKFSKYKDVQNDNGKLILIPKYGNNKEIDLTEINPEDVNTVVAILKENIG